MTVSQTKNKTHFRGNDLQAVQRTRRLGRATSLKIGEELFLKQYKYNAFVKKNEIHLIQQIFLAESNYNQSSLLQRA